MKKGLFLLPLLLAGCASTLKPEAKLPTPEELQRLLEAPTPNVKPVEFHLEAPHWVLWGSSYRVTCYIPENLGAGAFSFGVIGINMSEANPIGPVQNSKVIDRAECGHWTAVCKVSAEGGDRYAEQAIDVRGGACEQDGGGE